MNNIDLKLYKKTQKEVIKYVKDILKSKKISFKEYCGNLYSIRFQGLPVFVAHMDTVNDFDMKKQLVFDKELQILSRQDGILGADDKAGVNLILNHIENVNFILTIDEEIGALGMQELVDKSKLLDDLIEFNVSCAIELDRKGTNDILGDTHGYCGKDLQVQLENALPGYLGNVGVFTDIDYLCDIIASTNISVGYFNQHSKNEYLDVKHFNWVNDRMVELNKITGKFSLGNMNKYGLFDSYSFESCSFCDGYHNVIYNEFLTKYICSDCREILMDELTWGDY
jgi:hypothetical protein